MQISQLRIGHLRETNAPDLALEGHDDGPEPTLVQAFDVIGDLDHIARPSTAKTRVGHAQIIGGSRPGAAQGSQGLPASAVTTRA